MYNALRRVTLLLMVLLCSLAVAQQLQLTPNEVYFDRTGALKCLVDSTQTGSDLNQGKFLTHVDGWSRVDDSIVWYVDFTQTGNFDVSISIDGAAAQEGSEINVTVANESTQAGTSNLMTLQNVTGSGPQLFDAGSFNISQAGLYSIRFNLQTLTTTKIGLIDKVELTGTAVNNTTIRQVRWRPAAAHANFKNSQSPSGIQLAVMEIETDTPDFESYNPLTAPFGYFGSVWNTAWQGGEKWTDPNFSLWSFGANDPEPPVEELSHLLVAGKGMYFSGFDHEGTGVKLRSTGEYSSNLFGSQLSRKITYALRKVPGTLYDTYYSYYLGTDGNWKIYGAGRKHNSSGTLKDLTVGCFVEVPGPAEVERTGHQERTIRYRGWLVDGSDNLHQVDKMTTVSTRTGVNKRWTAQSDGWFTVGMGGMDTRDNVSTYNSTWTSPTPDYLQADKLNQLLSVPFSVTVTAPTTVPANSLSATFDAQGFAADATATIYWGTTDGLTLTEKWQSSKSLGSVVNGTNQFTLDGLSPDTSYSYRIKVESSEGAAWTFDTYQVTTGNLVTVGDLTGMVQVDAEAELVSTGLTVGSTSTEFSDTIAKGSVVSQSIAAGTNVALGTAVDLVVSAGVKNEAMLAEYLFTGSSKGDSAASTLNTSSSLVNKVSGTQAGEFGYLQSEDIDGSGAGSETSTALTWSARSANNATDTYFEFTVTTAADINLNYSRLTFDATVNSTIGGTTGYDYNLYWSVDNFTTPIGQTVGTPLLSGSDDMPYTALAIDLVTLPSQSGTVTFRLDPVTSAAASSNGVYSQRGGAIDNIQLYGAAAPIALTEYTFEGSSRGSLSVNGLCSASDFADQPSGSYASEFGSYVTEDVDGSGVGVVTSTAVGWSARGERDAVNSYFEFTVTPANDVALDFSQLTFDAMVNSTLSGTTSYDYNLYWSVDNYSSPVGQVVATPSISGAGDSAYTAVAMDLVSLATIDSAVTFRLDPVTSAGAGTNGVYSQRGGAIDNVKLYGLQDYDYVPNTAPVAGNDSASTVTAQAVVVDVLANDNDSDGHTLSIESVTQGQYGTVVNNGSDVTYTSYSDFAGIDSFSYTVSDGNGGTDTATVNVTVEAVVPNVVGMTLATAESTLVSAVLTVGTVTEGCGGL